jgi:hypothetical protein
VQALQTRFLRRVVPFVRYAQEHCARWVKAGLPTCDGERPILILGRELAGDLKARRTKTSSPAIWEKSIACDAALRNSPPEIWRTTNQLQRNSGT